MSPALPHCPSCHAEDVVKNGRTRHGKQNYKCRECGHQFVEDPQWRAISDETKGIVERLLLENILVAGIARALQISEENHIGAIWNFIHHYNASLPANLSCPL